jgi:hypothetical protein
MKDQSRPGQGGSETARTTDADAILEPPADNPQPAVPAITDDMSTLEAAYAYAKAGLYIGPSRRGTKDPGSVLGKNWQLKTSRDAQVITSWFAGTNHGLFIHAGRSGLWIADVDDPARIHPKLQQAIAELKPPYQATRTDQRGRGHYLFQCPPGRDFGNGLGQLANGWGEGRSRNGVIIVAPSEHEKDAEGGCYQWVRTGPVPVLPDYAADLLPDAMDASDAATDADVAAFLAKFGEPTGERLDLLNIHVGGFRKALAAGESRHATMIGHITGRNERSRRRIPRRQSSSRHTRIGVPRRSRPTANLKQAKQATHRRHRQKRMGRATRMGGRASPRRRP